MYYQGSPGQPQASFMQGSIAAPAYSMQSSMGYQTAYAAQPMTTYAQEQVTPSARKEKRRSVKADPDHHQGVAKSAVEKVHLMHQEMAEVESTLDNLQKTNSWLKNKLLQDRKDLLEKYFTADSYLLKQANFREWKHLVEVEKRIREVEGLKNLTLADRANMDKGVLELEREVHEAQITLHRAQQEKTDLDNRLAQAEHLLRTVGGQLGGYPENRVPKVPADQAENYMKAQIRGLLTTIR